jgi:Zn-finger nucleic acid-binding protein
MNCPACPTRPPLKPQALESSLVARACPQCGGQWVRSADYWRWRAGHGANLPERGPEETAPLPLNDRRGVKRCPDCGDRFLTTYRVGKRVPFTIDRCRNCEGIWLDRDEWAALRARNLHDDLHLVFTDDWQRDLRKEDRRFLTDTHFERMFGAEDFARIREVRAWLDGHPRAGELLSYLQQNVRRAAGDA